MAMTSNWFFWALLSAVFAALSPRTWLFLALMIGAGGAGDQEMSQHCF
jgi:hypothetical protein